MNQRFKPRRIIDSAFLLNLEIVAALLSEQDADRRGNVDALAVIDQLAAFLIDLEARQCIGMLPTRQKPFSTRDQC